MKRRWTAEQLLDVVRGFQPACVIIAAAELDVFTALYKKAMPAQSLADELKIDTRATTILLDALAALGLLTKKGNLYCVGSEVGKILAERSARSVLSAVRHQGNCLRRWVQLSRVTQTGKPADRPPSIRGQDADRAAFIGAMENFSAPVARKVIARLRRLNFSHLLDIGGASGTWTIAFLQAAAEAKATLFDLPEVIPLARRHIRQAGLSNRVRLVAGDFYSDDLPAGADFAWLSAVAHQNSRGQNRELFARIYAALSKTGVLVIRDVVMDESRSSPMAGAMFAVNMLVGTEGGGTFTFAEFREDLTEAGFKKVTLVHRDEAMNSLIRAEKSAR